MHTLRTRVIRTHLALDMEGSVPNSEGDAVQKCLRLFSQWGFDVLKVIVGVILSSVAAAAAIRS